MPKENKQIKPKHFEALEETKSNNRKNRKLIVKLGDSHIRYKGGQKENGKGSCAIMSDAVLSPEFSKALGINMILPKGGNVTEERFNKLAKIQDQRWEEFIFSQNQSSGRWGTMSKNFMLDLGKKIGKIVDTAVTKAVAIAVPITVEKAMVGIRKGIKELKVDVTQLRHDVDGFK